MTYLTFFQFFPIKITFRKIFMKYLKNYRVRHEFHFRLKSWLLRKIIQFFQHKKCKIFPLYHRQKDKKAKFKYFFV